MSFTQAELLERRGFLGASEAAAAVGRCNFFSPLQLFKSKIGEGEQIEETLPMAVGTALEATTIAWFAKEQGLTVHSQQKRIVDPTLPWRRATLDGISSDGGVVQAKSSGMYGWWGAEEDAVPESIILQTQHEMACSGLPFAWVPVIIGQRTFRVYRVERDEELIQLLTAGEQEFMGYVERREPPPPRDTDDLKILYPCDTGIEIVASSDIEALAYEWAATKAEIKTLEDAEEASGFRIREFMGDSAVLKDSKGKPLATWRANVEKRLDVTAFRKDHPGLAEQYSPEKTVRKLLNKIKVK